MQKSLCQGHRLHLAKAAGSQEYGTARLISSRKTRLTFVNLTIDKGRIYPVIARDFVAAASSCQDPVKLNMALKLPSGTDPEIFALSLKYFAICKLKAECTLLYIDQPQEWTVYISTGLVFSALVPYIPHAFLTGW